MTTESSVALGLLLVVSGLIVAAFWHDCSAEDRFMRECQADGHKRYECEALHRAGDSHVMPVPVIIQH